MLSQSLLDMPDIAMRKITEELDMVSIQRLRKTCHDLRNFLDDHPPNPALTKIDLRIDSKVIYCIFYLENREFRTEYHKAENGSIVIWRESSVRSKKLLENEDPVQLASGDLDTILRHQKSPMKAFDVDYAYPLSEEMKLVKAFSESLERILNLRRRPLQVEIFRGTVIDHNQIIHVLPYLDPSFLKSIIIFNGRGFCKYLEVLEMSQILELEQWKNSETVTIRNFIVDVPIQSLIHFKRVYVGFKAIKIDMILELKEVFLNSPHMPFFEFQYENNEAEDQMVRLFGPPLKEHDGFNDWKRKWFFQIPYSDLLLTIRFYKNVMVADRIDYKKLPENARIII